MTPSARAIADCKLRGWTAQVVEQTIRIPGGRTFKRDLYGCIDIVALTGAGILGIQVTSGAHNAERHAKILAEPRMKLWLESGARLAVWSYSKRGARGKRKTWVLREVEVRVEEFESTRRGTCPCGGISVGEACTREGCFFYDKAVAA